MLPPEPPHIYPRRVAPQPKANDPGHIHAPQSGSAPAANLSPEATDSPQFAAENFPFSYSRKPSRPYGRRDRSVGGRRLIVPFPRMAN